MKQRRLTDAIAADESDARAGYDLHGTVIDQLPSGDPDRDVINGKHAALSPDPPPNATRLFGKSLRMTVAKRISAAWSAQ
jgi:hypothetical protein